MGETSYSGGSKMLISSQGQHIFTIWNQKGKIRKKIVFNLLDLK